MSYDTTAARFSSLYVPTFGLRYLFHNPLLEQQWPVKIDAVSFVAVEDNRALRNGTIILTLIIDEVGNSRRIQAKWSFLIRYKNNISCSSIHVFVDD